MLSHGILSQSTECLVDVICQAKRWWYNNQQAKNEPILKMLLD